MTQALWPQSWLLAHMNRSATPKKPCWLASPYFTPFPFHLSPWQASVLDELSIRKGRVLRFIELFQYQGAIPSCRGS
jgi:hypothetical protein